MWSNCPTVSASGGLAESGASLHQLPLDRKGALIKATSLAEQRA